MLRLNTRDFFIAKNNTRIGYLKYWEQAGYFTSPMHPGLRWNHNGEELTIGRGRLYAVEPMDINRIDFDASVEKEESATGE